MGCAPLVIKGLPAKEYFRQYRLRNRPNKRNEAHYAGLWPREMESGEARLYRKWFNRTGGHGVFTADWRPPARVAWNRKTKEEKRIRVNNWSLKYRRKRGETTREEYFERRRQQWGAQAHVSAAFKLDQRGWTAQERSHDEWWSKAARMVRPIDEWRLGALRNPILFMQCLAAVGRIDKKAKRAAWKKKARSNPNCRTFLVERIRRRISRSIKDGKGMKSGKSREIIGCDWQFLRDHIEAQFAPGMTWENYGYYGWHIDHIVPLCRFDLADPAQVKRAWNFTNLQPLWAADNYAKLDS